jgi:hypothetical protein
MAASLRRENCIGGGPEYLDICAGLRANINLKLLNFPTAIAMRYDLIVVLAVACLIPAVWIVMKLVQWWDRLARIESGIERREEGSDRTRMRLNVLSVRSNVASLVLISLAAFLLVSLEVYRTMWPDRSSSSAALEELLRAKLPDAEVQAQWHREIVDASRNARPADPSKPPDEQWSRKLADVEGKLAQLKQQFDGMKTRVGVLAEPPPIPSHLPAASVLMAIALTVGAFLIGGLFYILAKRQLISQQAGKAAAATSLAIGSVLGGTTLLKDFSLFRQLDVKEFSFVKIQRADPLQAAASQPVVPQPVITPEPVALQPANPQPVPPPPATDVHVDLNLRLLEPSSATVECAHHVGPFGDGNAMLSGDEREQLQSMIVDIAKKAERVIAVLLIGSADKRALTPKTAKTYTSNLGLAEARVEFVQSELKPLLGTADFIRSFRGPTKTADNASAEDLKEDRSVEICLVMKSGKP